MSNIDKKRSVTVAMMTVAIIAVVISTGSYQGATAQSSARNTTGSQNQTNMMMMGPNITGSISLGPTIAKAIASQVHISLANASETAEKAVGALRIGHVNSVAVRIGVVQGFLVYMAIVVDSGNNFHGVLVDAGNGKVLASTPMSLGYLNALAGIMSSSMGGSGPSMMVPSMSAYSPGMMQQHGMMKGFGMMMGHP